MMDTGMVKSLDGINARVLISRQSGPLAAYVMITIWTFPKKVDTKLSCV
jgi:hypothetical protein